MSAARRNVKVGCCGFRLSRAEYFARFPVVEVQQTFYQPPRVETLRGWREAAPEDFEFTIKAWMLITHEARSPTYRRLKRELTEEEREEAGSFRPTRAVRAAWEATRASAEALGARRVLFQCPASFRPVPENIRNLRKFFSSVGRDQLIFLWEPRGEWPRELIAELCAELDLTHVVDPLVERTVTPGRCYFRLHVRRGGRKTYEDEELSELYSMLPRGETSYVLFNNVRMVDDAGRFQRLMREEGDADA
ncbi:MAG TPA: DUF72 domain-containing protein [Pyrinomonadaceae bacterium]|nr:DUF72 domain-containing protein [Pyrinomonadaceae bacterium]